MVAVQHFRRQYVLQPLQLHLIRGTLMHFPTRLQTRLHTHFLMEPIGTKGSGVSDHLNAKLASSFQVG